MKEPILTVRQLVRVAGLVRRGRVYQALVWHEPHCRRPAGQPCTCDGEPEIELKELRPSSGRWARA